MSIATHQPTTEDRFRQTYEQFYCLTEGCGSRIAGECVCIDYDRKTGVRRVKGYCEHCQRAYEQTYQLAGGGWSPIGSVTEITDPRKLKGIRVRIDKLRGDRRIVAFSA